MTNLNAAPRTRHLSAIVEALPDQDPQLGHRCLLYTQDGLLEAWTWHDRLCHAASRTHVGVVTLLEIDTGRTDNLLVGFSADGNQPLSHLLPHDLCPIPGLVFQTARLIDQLTIPPLRRLITRALVRKDVLRHYWISPASMRDHHAYPGGLAEHSLEIAVAVASARGLPDVYRELGIVYALLHDYGKVWCMNPTLRDPEEARGHEALGYDILETDLDILESEAENLAAVMRELLGGPRAPREGNYPLAIRRVVQAFDQMSCEKTRPTATQLCATLDWGPAF